MAWEHCGGLAYIVNIYKLVNIHGAHNYWKQDALGAAGVNGWAAAGPRRSGRGHIVSPSTHLAGAKDDGGDGDNCSYRTCKAPVKSSPLINKHPTFYRPDALPVAQPTLRALKANHTIYISPIRAIANNEQTKLLTFCKPVGFGSFVIFFLFLAVFNFVRYIVVEEVTIQFTITKYSQNHVLHFSVTAKSNIKFHQSVKHQTTSAMFRVSCTVVQQMRIAAEVNN